MNRVTVITGGTSGIGRGIVEKVLANADKDDLIFATYAHNADKANAFWESLSPEDQEKLIILKADMSSYEDMMAFVQEVKNHAGHVDWLISNAGISTYDKFQDYTFEEWNHIVNTNLSIPGFIQTPWHENRTQESYDRINRKIALHRFGEIKDVADMAYSILTNHYMNGSIVDIHGGYDYF